MKTRLLLRESGMIVLLLAASALAARAATISVTFGYTFEAGNAACSTTVTTNCMNHFEVGTLSAAGVFTTLASIALPAAPTGTVSGIAGSFAQTGAYNGKHEPVFLGEKEEPTSPP
jgi:hypothetical protein